MFLDTILPKVYELKPMATLVVSEFGLDFLTKKNEFGFDFLLLCSFLSISRLVSQHVGFVF